MVINDGWGPFLYRFLKIPEMGFKINGSLDGAPLMCGNSHACLKAHSRDQEPWRFSHLLCANYFIKCNGQQSSTGVLLRNLQ